MAPMASSPPKVGRQPWRPCVVDLTSSGLGLALDERPPDALKNPAELAAVSEAISTEVNGPDLLEAASSHRPMGGKRPLHDLAGCAARLLRQQEKAGEVVVAGLVEPDV